MVHNAAETNPDRSKASFSTTQWSMVVDAGAPRDTLESRDALQSLCGRYWGPLYAFARRSGNQPADAEDLVQGFFSELLRRDAIAAANPERGRFRTFLLSSFRNYCANEHRRATAAKRGGEATIVSLESLRDYEVRLADAVKDGSPAERQFHRDWAAHLFTTTLHQMAREYAKAKKAREFEVLKKAFLVGPETRTAEAWAREVKMTAGAWRVALHRFKKRFAARYRDEVAETVEEASEVDVEIQELRAALNR